MTYPDDQLRLREDVAVVIQDVPLRDVCGILKSAHVFARGQFLVQGSYL